MTTILLIRHAQCEGNVIKALTGRTDFKLTDIGKKMALNLKEKLKKCKIDKIYSSSSSRCIETVRPLAEYLNLTIITDDNLMEKYFGIYDGMTWEDVKKRDAQLVVNKEKFNEIIGIEGQETTEQVRERMRKTIYKIAEGNKNKTIAICSHGCAIENFLRSIDNVKQTEEREKYAQHNAQVNLLEYNDHKFKIIAMSNQS